MSAANQAAAAAAAFADIGQQVQAFLDVAQAQAADGLTWQEFGQLAVALLKLAVGTLDRMTGLSGEEKRDLALAAVGTLFDLVAGHAVPFPAWPLWAVARPAIRSLVLALSAGALEQILPLVRSA